MKIKLMLIGCAFLMFNGSVALAELDLLTPYDDFNTKKFNGCKYCINPEKWMGSQRGDYVTDLQRVIKAKRARLSHRSWGRSDSDVGREQGRNRMVFRDSANMSGACFVPRVKKYDMQDCATNDGSSQVRIRYMGKFFDADIADLGQDDGMVYAAVEVRRYVDSAEKKAMFDVVGWVTECEGVDCATDAWNTVLNFGTVKASLNKKELCLAYDRDNNEFMLSYGSDVRTVSAVDGLPGRADFVPSDQAWQVIETRTDVENCTSGPISAFIDADFDKVKIREIP